MNLWRATLRRHPNFRCEAPWASACNGSISPPYSAAWNPAALKCSSSPRYSRQPSASITSKDIQSVRLSRRSLACRARAAPSSWSRSSTHAIRHRTINSRKNPPPHPIPAVPGSTPSFHGAHNWMSLKPTRRLRILGGNASLPRETCRPDPKTHRNRWYRQRRFSPDRLRPPAIMLLQVPEGPRRVFPGKRFQ